MSLYPIPITLITPVTGTPPPSGPGSGTDVGGTPAAGPANNVATTGTLGLPRVNEASNLRFRNGFSCFEMPPVPCDMRIISATLYCQGGADTQSCRLVWWENDDDGMADTPGALIGAGSQLTVSAGASLTDRALPVPASLTLQAGVRYRPSLWMGGTATSSTSGMIIPLEDGMGVRIDAFTGSYSSSGSPPSTFPSYAEDDEKDGFPRLIITYEADLPAGAVTGTMRLTVPSEVAITTQVLNDFAGPHLWRSESAHVPDPPVANWLRYQRYNWDDLENATGTAYTLNSFIADAQAAADAGLKFAFRIRGQEQGSTWVVPAYLDGLTGSGFWTNTTTVQPRWQALIQAVRNRLASEGLLSDIAWVEYFPGSYGEGTNWTSNSQSRTFYADTMADIFQGDGIPYVIHVADEASLAVALARTDEPLVGIRDDIWGEPDGSLQLGLLQTESNRHAIRRAAEDGRLVLGEPTPHPDAFMETFRNQAYWFQHHSVGNGNWNTIYDYPADLSAQEQADMRDAYMLSGYRIGVADIDVPDPIINSTIQTWRIWFWNRGWSWPPAVGTWTAELRLRNNSGEYTCTLSSLDVRTLRPTGAAPVVWAGRLEWVNIPDGTYSLDLRISNSRWGAIALETGVAQSDGWYRQSAILELTVTTGAGVDTRITEGGDTRITEAGDTRILE